MKTVIITGASQGLGLITAKAFAANGWLVIGTGRSPRPAGVPETIRYEQFDADNAEAAEAFWLKLKDSVDLESVCLVNNAGSYIGGGLLEAKPESFESQMRSNYFAGVYMTRGLVAVVPHARVINIISASALAPAASTSAYGASKAAGMHFFHALQKEFEAARYRITNLYPTDIATHGPAPHAIDPQDLAAFIVGQAENESSYYLTDVTLHASK